MFSSITAHCSSSTSWPAAPRSRQRQVGYLRRPGTRASFPGWRELLTAGGRGPAGQTRSRPTRPTATRDIMARILTGLLGPAR